MSTITVLTHIAPCCEEEGGYKECCRNHAVAAGGACYDGCNEYMKASHNLNPQNTFLCACCGCHRNYHRKQTVANNPVPQTETEGNHVLDVVPVSDLGHVNNPEPEPVQQVKPPRRKRTTFTRDQKIQMTRFADILGWKPHKGNREEIQRFCDDMGINRKVFVVWLNNNRHRATQNANLKNDSSTT